MYNQKRHRKQIATSVELIKVMYYIVNLICTNLFEYQPRFIFGNQIVATLIYYYYIILFRIKPRYFIPISEY